MALSLSLNKISKKYGQSTVISNCSFVFEPDSIYTIMGSNGAGKSTLLKICSLLESPDTGSIDYFEAGNTVEHDVSLKRRLTLVLPDIGLFNTTVAGNAGYGLRVRGVPKKNEESMVRKVLDYVCLGDKYRQNALSLSSGEKQRLGIARALVIEPEVIFLDEPTASVDDENTRIIESIILDLKSRGGIKLIMTTHDVAQAARLADVQLVLESGRISVV